MNYYPLLKPFMLAGFFIKEQLKEPVSLFWVLVSPVVTFYLLNYARTPVGGLPVDYVSSASWFYSFVSSSVALFGLAFYIVGRRESGFLRSFVFARQTKAIFVVGQFLAYSVMSVLYCSAFYIFTRAYFGVMSFAELVVVVGRFYICFLLFSTPALLLTLIPMGFQNTSTVFSILSFMMLALGIISLGQNPLLGTFAHLNPMWWANQIMQFGVAESLPIVVVIVVLFTCSFCIILRFLRVNPVWSRY
jgi:ABC-2 type transport system permease protein